MSIIDRPRNPSSTELKVFGLILLLIAGVVGALVRWRLDADRAAWWVWSIGAGLVVIYYALPPLRGTFFRAWMRLVYPLGWTFSHLLLCAIFYLVMAPIGFLLRAFRYDPMQRRLRPGVDSYWLRRNERSPESYFRQF